MRYLAILAVIIASTALSGCVYDPYYPYGYAPSYYGGYYPEPAIYPAPVAVGFDYYGGPRYYSHSGYRYYGRGYGGRGYGGHWHH